MLCPPLVVVAPDYIDRGDFLQSVDEYRLVDVAVVDDGVTTGNGGQTLRAEQPVGIGQYRNSLCLFSHSNSFSISATAISKAFTRRWARVI